MHVIRWAIMWAALETLAGLSFAGAACAQNVAAGEKIFNQKCKVCHMIGPGAQNSTGPNLSGVIGRKTGSAPDYDYSPANKGSGLTWDEATFKDYITDPRKKIPGTKMIFAGLPKASERDALFEYLSQFDATGNKK